MRAAAAAGAAKASGRLSRLTRAQHAKLTTLVVSGGGMKGVASFGAVVALRRAGALRHVSTVVGTSAGALVAAALAVGRARASLVDELAVVQYAPDLDLDNVLDNVRTGFGLDNGRNLDEWIRRILGDEAYTFRRVRDEHGVRLVVCATNVNQRRAEYFGPDTNPDMDVALALRMSCSIPLCLSAVRHEGTLYVDGAVSDNFPLEWAATHGDGGRTLGVAFKPRASHPAHTLEAYVGALVECSTRRNYAASKLPAGAHVLELDTGANSAFDFRMSRRRLRGLFASGARQARAWLKKTE